MASTLPPDPYQALGVSRDADIAAIKAAYRKLAPKRHPDRVRDESLKKQRQEEFYNIQQAYELTGHEDSRKTYEAEERIDALLRELRARNAGAPSIDAKLYDPYPKHSTSRSSRLEKEPAIRVRTVHPDRTRLDHDKSRERDERKERISKFVYAEEEARKLAAEARRKANERRRSPEDIRYSRSREHSDLPGPLRYISRSRAEVEPRPSVSRTPSSRDARPEYREARSSRRERPETVRRSSARPKDRPVSPGRERVRGRISEIFEWSDDRKSPSFRRSDPPPADIHVPPVRRSSSESFSRRFLSRSLSAPPFRSLAEPLSPRSPSRRSSLPSSWSYTRSYSRSYGGPRARRTIVVWKCQSIVCKGRTGTNPHKDSGCCTWSRTHRDKKKCCHCQRLMEQSKMEFNSDESCQSSASHCSDAASERYVAASYSGDDTRSRSPSIRSIR